MKALDLTDADISPQFPSRNGSCKAISDSRQTKLLSSFYKIDVDAETQFYEYNIRALPLIANKGKIKKLIETLLGTWQISLLLPINSPTPTSAPHAASLRPHPRTTPTNSANAAASISATSCPATPAFTSLRAKPRRRQNRFGAR
ncbi:hypothetical protein HBI26_225660 [Parastagonospora nodorum]|nr:hypothetical protein HBI26_225660 [Parastagonospora nodorum]